MSRESKIIVATGKKGTGKSYTTLWELIVPYAKGLLNNGVPRKCLIFDTQGEYQKTSNTNNNIFPKTPEHKKLTNGSPLDILMLDVNDVSAFAKQQRIEIRRVPLFYTKTTFDKKGRMLTKKGDEFSPEDKVEALKTTVRNFNNGLLLIEDLRALFGDKIPHNIISLIVSNRHKNMDVVWHLQSVGRLLPEQWENVNAVRFHKEEGSVDYHETKLQEKYPIFKICDNLVNGYFRNGYERMYAWFDKDKGKVRGKFTKETFLWAIEQYIKTTPSSIKSLLRETERGGSQRYSYDEAVRIKKEELFYEYYGNKN